jgi:O-antigen ligase
MPTSAHAKADSDLTQMTAGFFAIALLVLLVLRSMLDRAGFGFLVGLLLIGVALIRLVSLKQISKRLTLILIIGTTVIAWGYLHALQLHWEPVFSLRGVIRYSCYFAALIIAFYSRVTINQIYRAYGLVVLLQVIFTVAERLAFGEVRPDGTLLNANHISYLLIPYAAFSLIHYQFHIRTIGIVAFSVFIGGLGGVISLLFLIGGYIFYRGNLKIRLMAASLAPIVLLAAFFALEHRIEEQADITTLETRLEQGQAGGGGSLVWRAVTWKLMLDELQAEGGVLLGRGIDHASISSPYFLKASPIEPHNDYVRIMLEFGVVGLLLYLAIYASVTRYFLKAGMNDSVSAALGWSLMALALGQFVGNIVVQSTLWWFFFAFVGVHFRSVAHRRKSFLLAERIES